MDEVLSVQSPLESQICQATKGVVRFLIQRPQYKLCSRSILYFACYNVTTVCILTYTKVMGFRQRWINYLVFLISNSLQVVFFRYSYYDMIFL